MQKLAQLVVDEWVPLRKDPRSSTGNSAIRRICLKAEMLRPLLVHEAVPADDNVPDQPGRSPSAAGREHRARVSIDSGRGGCVSDTGQVIPFLFTCCCQSARLSHDSGLSGRPVGSPTRAVPCISFDRPATLPESRLVALREEPGHLLPGQLSEEFVANMAGTYERLEAFSRHQASSANSTIANAWTTPRPRLRT